MVNVYADVSGLVDGDPNLASSVKTPINQLDQAIQDLEAAGLLLFSITAQQAGEALSERDVVYLSSSDSKWYQLDTDATPVEVGAIRGVVAESGGIPISTTGEVRVVGQVDGFTGLTAFAPVYASSTAGGYTQTKPTVTDGGAQKALVQIGVALSTTALMVLNHYPVVYLKRESLADDGTLTVQHHSDGQTRTRQVRGVVLETVAGSSLTDYADTNQDEDVNLKDRTPATYGSDQCSGGTAIGDTPIDETLAAAFDDSDATGPKFSGTSCNIGYDFGTEKTIRRYTLTDHTGVNNIQNFKDWTFQWSDNGSDWNTIDTVTGETSWGSGETRTFDVDTPQAARYWRFSVSALDTGNNATIGEIEMMEVATWTDGDEKLAQSFEVTGAQTVGSVKLWLKKVGSPTGNLTVKLYDDNSGEPGSLVTNGTSNTVAASGLSTSYGWIEFQFGTAPSLSGSTTYWLVLETADSADESDYVVWGADGSSPGYTDGEMVAYDGSSWSAESKDGCFEVFGEGSTYEEPVSIQRWGMADTLDLAVRYDDGSDSDADTKTTFKNVSGETLDVTCMVEVG